MYCSRKSIEVTAPRLFVQKTARGLSINGTMMLSPLEATRLKRPRRSINITVACGTILIVLAAITSSTIPRKNRKKIMRNAGTTASDCSKNRLANDIVTSEASRDWRADYNETRRFRQLESSRAFDNRRRSKHL